MIQRIQSIYLAVAIILLSVLSTGVTILEFAGKESVSKFSTFGLYWTNDIAKNPTSEHADFAFPFYIVSILLVLMLFVTLMGYKNLKRQLNLAKYTFLVYTLLSLALVIYSILAGEHLFSETVKTHFGIGYFLFLAGLPLTFLALKAIKKDKSLIDSVDRIR